MRWCLVNIFKTSFYPLIKYLLGVSNYFGIRSCVLSYCSSGKAVSSEGKSRGCGKDRKERETKNHTFLQCTTWMKKNFSQNASLLHFLRVPSTFTLFICILLMFYYQRIYALLKTFWICWSECLPPHCPLDGPPLTSNLISTNTW